MVWDFSSCAVYLTWRDSRSGDTMVSLGDGEGACNRFQRHPETQQGWDRAQGPYSASLVFFFFFLMSTRTCLSGVLQLALATLSLFDLLSLCFRRCFTPTLTVCRRPKALGHLPGSEIKCEVKYNSAAHHHALSLPAPLLPSPESGVPRRWCPGQWAFPKNVYSRNFTQK